MIVELYGNKSLVLHGAVDAKVSHLHNWVKFLDEDEMIVAMYNLNEIKGFYRLGEQEKKAPKDYFSR